MKILMFGMSSYPGGIENYIANYFLSDEFASKMTIDFVTYEGRLAYEDKIKQCGYNVKCVPHLKKHPIGYIKAVKKLLKEGKYDCVYVNMLSAANAVPLKYASKFKVPKIVAHAHANSTVSGWLRKLLHRKNKKYCDKCANVKLACSQNAGKWIFNEEFSLVPNAIDGKRFSFNADNRREIREFWNIPHDAFVVGQVGRLSEEKNHTFSLEVFKEIININNNSYLIFVGDGALKMALQEKAKLLGVEDKVIFAGTSNQAEKYYSAFDCFIFPSIFEGFGMGALEAQANGLRCFCSDTLSPELNVSGNVKFLPLSLGAISWAQQMVENSNNHIRKDFTLVGTEYDINKQIQKLVDLLK